MSFRFSLLALVVILAGFSVDLDGDGPRKSPRLTTETPDVYYVIERNVTVYRDASNSRPYLALSMREPVYLIEQNGDWSRVRTREGSEGFVQKDAISNVWIRVSKRNQMLYLYRGMELLRAFPADFGFNAFADKERRGSAASPDDWRTPDGSFYVVRKNPNSSFYKGFVLNYPNAETARRGYADGIITASQRDAILAAEMNAEMPPMNTPLGGWIMIHGHGTGDQDNWTMGCVAVRNLHMDMMWNIVKVGTPVFVGP
jgi:murein L,D-transpeptidase YafK